MKHITSQHYSELLNTIERLRERLYISEINLKKETKRADLLQADLDVIDDFNALVESEVARSLNNKRIN